MRTRTNTAAELTDRQRRSIALAIASGVPVLVLQRSGRYPGITVEVIARIADEANVVRKRSKSRVGRRP
jgi:hypothetical protein